METDYFRIKEHPEKRRRTVFFILSSSIADNKSYSNDIMANQAGFIIIRKTFFEKV